MNTEQPYQKLERSCLSRCFSTLTAGDMGGSIFNLCAAKIGVGVAVIPYAYAHSGVVFGTMIFIATAFLCRMYYNILIYSMEKLHQESAVELVTVLYGNAGKIMTKVFVFGLNFGTMCLFIMLVGILMPSILVSLGIFEDSPDYAYRVWAIILFSVFFWLPLVLPTEVSILSKIALLRLITISYVLILICIGTPTYIDNNRNFTFDVELFVLDSRWLFTVGICYFSYDSFQVVPTLYAKLDVKSILQMDKVITRSYLFLLGVFLVIGILGYLSFVDNIPVFVLYRPILDGFSNLYDWPMVLARVLALIALSAAVPPIFYNLRTLMGRSLFGVSYQPKNTLYYTMTIGLLLLATLVSIAVRVPMTYFKVLGGGFCSVLSFGVPTMVYLKTSARSIMKILVAALSIVLIGLGLVCSLIEISTYL